MGAMRKMAVYLGLVEDETEAYEVDESDPYEQAVQRRYTQTDRGSSSRREEAKAPAPVRDSRDVRMVPPSERPAPRTERLDRVEVRDEPGPALARDAAPESYRITTLHPRSYNDARRIGEEFRQGVPVIINLTEMDDVDAKRIVDFSAGLIFGRHGSIERVTNKVFLLSPDNVDVTAEARRLAQDGFFNQS
jgi:cell division inhibitor SepF